MTWLERAACKGMDPDVFFDRDPSLALSVCRRCPVKDECRADGDATEDLNNTYGVRAGERASERMDRRFGRTTWVSRGEPRELKAIRHGTRTGAQTHRNRGEDVCEACLAADALYARVYAARQAGEGPVVVSHAKRRAS
jgi:hypothetical protein